MKEIKQILKSPLFISMATAAKFVLPIPIFLAIPFIKLHETL
jgi:hypothetical protein